MARNTDHDDMIYDALIKAGCVESDMIHAEFILHDAVHEGYAMRGDSRPSFVYPHTPQSWFLWDGMLVPNKVSCNFVAGEGAIRGMRSYGYPHRIEAIGFTRCAVKPFQPTPGRKLLIVPAHRTRANTYSEPDYVNRAIGTIRRFFWHRSICNYFESITICWDEPALVNFARKYAGDRSIKIVPTNPYKDRNPLVSMMERIDNHDLVLSCGTVGCVSVAMGKPTVFFGEEGVPHTPPGRAARNFHLYSDIIRHPLMAEKMSLDEMVDVCKAPDPRAEKWKHDIIGDNFDAEKFISVIKEFV